MKTMKTGTTAAATDPALSVVMSIASETVPSAPEIIAVCPKCQFPKEFHTTCPSPFHVIGRRWTVGR